MGDLVLERPLKGPANINSYYNKWRDILDDNNKVIGRRQHKGTDYYALIGTSVYASESGLVVRASRHPSKKANGRSFGNLIIIYHNPGKPDPDRTKDRHIYTLYAHLSKMSAKAKYGEYVEKGEKIGESGKTGGVYRHLHFEVIDAGGELKWKPTGSTGIGGAEHREDPECYFGVPKNVEGTLTDIVDRNIMDRIEWVPDIDFMRSDSFRLQAWLDGRNIGYVNKYHDRLEADIEYDLKEELDKIGRGSLPTPQDETIRLEYTISLQ